MCRVQLFWTINASMYVSTFIQIEFFFHINYCYFKILLNTTTYSLYNLNTNTSPNANTHTNTFKWERKRKTATATAAAATARRLLQFYCCVLLKVGWEFKMNAAVAACVLFSYNVFLISLVPRFLGCSLVKTTPIALVLIGFYSK